MTSRLALQSSAALLFCFCPIAQAIAAPEATPKPSSTATQPAPVFSLGGISIAPGPQCFAGPTLNAGRPAKPETPHPHRPTHRAQRVAEPVPLRTYARI